MYLLDTNACISFLRGRVPALTERLRSHDPTELSLCSTVKAELLYGARHSGKVDDNLQLLSEFFAPYRSYGFDDRCAEQYGMIRAELASQRTLIGANDMLIAATARAHDATLVTHNTGEFSRVSGLRLEDWGVPNGNQQEQDGNG